MAKQTINIGTMADDKSGDPLRTAFNKINENFTEVYNKLFTTVPTSSVGQAGDLAGYISVDSNYFYYCSADYDGVTNIWGRIPVATSAW